MNRFINLYTASWFRGFVIVTILFSLFMLPGNLTVAKAQTKDFYLKFKEVRVFNILTEHGSVVNERYDESGGSVDVNVRGEAYALCPGGAETLRFTWQLAQNISTITPASRIAANIEASQVASSPPCTTGIAARSLVVMHGSNGVVSPFSGDESLKMDGLTKSEDSTRYWADPATDPNGGVSAILVNEQASSGPDRQFAWFEFFISTSGGDLRYVYLFDIVRNGSNPPAGETPSSGGTPPGGDNAQTITWGTTATSVRGQNGKQFTFICPSGGTLDGKVWGTDLYTDDSSICMAAVHAGVINAANGGKVTIQVQPGGSSFTGSTNNGVTSAGWGAYPGGFTFVGAPGTSTTPPEPIPPMTGAKSPPCVWTGIWENPSWGKVTLNQNGNQIIGIYDHYIGPIPGSGQLSGTLSGKVIDGQWTQTQPKGNGTFQFILGDDCNIAGGTWSYGSSGPGTGGPLIGQPNTNVTNMTIQVARRQVITGELVLIPVWLIKASNVANLNFEITFNAAIAKPEGTLTKGNLLENVLFSANPNQAGKILSGFAGTTGISGTGTVLNIPFRAVGKPGDRALLDITVTTINDPSGTTLQIDRITGEILIYNKDGTFPGSTTGGPTSPPAPPTMMQGDCDGDGTLTEVDALCALEMSVQLRPVSLLVDMDKSGDVTSRDAVLILQKAIYKFKE